MDNKKLGLIIEEIIKSPFSELEINTKHYFPTYEDLVKDNDPVYSYIAFCQENKDEPPTEEQIIRGIRAIIEYPKHDIHYQILRLLADDIIKVVNYRGKWGEKFGFVLRED